MHEAMHEFTNEDVQKQGLYQYHFKTTQNNRNTTQKDTMTHTEIATATVY